MKIVENILRTLLAPWEPPPPSASAARIVEKIQQTLLGRFIWTDAHKRARDALSATRPQLREDGLP